MIKLLAYLSILLLLTHCSSLKTDHSNNQLHQNLGVNFENNNDKKSKPKIGESGEGSLSDEIGPLQKHENYLTTKGQSQTRVPVIAAILGPGLNRVVAHLSFLRALEEKNIKVHMISGSGLAAIVAALYASGMTTELIEWRFYQFFSQVKNVAPYSKEWWQAINKTLLPALRNKKIQNLELALFIPIFQKSKDRVVYKRRGDLSRILISSLYLAGYQKKQDDSAAFEWEVYNRKIFKEFGADIVIGANVLGLDVDFEKVNHYLLGAFGRAASFADKEKNELDFYVELDAHAIPLDSQIGIPRLMKESYKQSIKAAEEFNRRLSVGEQ